jgi:hypothetical protein
VRRAGAIAALVALGLAPPAATAADAEYELRLPAEVEAIAGADGAVSLTIAPAPGRTISPDGPLVIAVAAEPADALALPKRRYLRADAADARAEAPRFDLRFGARRPGSATLRVTVVFWVCGNRSCVPVEDAREVRVSIADAKDAAVPAEPE